MAFEPSLLNVIVWWENQRHCFPAI